MLKRNFLSSNFLISISLVNILAYIALAILLVGFVFILVVFINSKKKINLKEKNLFLLNNNVQDLIIYIIDGKIDFLGNFKLKHQFGSDFLVDPLNMKHRFVNYQDIYSLEKLNKKSEHTKENYTFKFLAYDLSNREAYLQLNKIFLNRKSSYMYVYIDVTSTSLSYDEADLRLKKIDFIEEFLSSKFINKTRDISTILKNFIEIYDFENAIFYGFDKNTNNIELIASANNAGIKKSSEKIFGIQYYYYIKNAIETNNIFIKNDQYFLTGISFPGIKEEVNIKNCLIFPCFSNNEISLFFCYNFKIFPDRNNIDNIFKYYKIFMQILLQRNAINNCTNLCENSETVINDLIILEAEQEEAVLEKKDILLIEDNYINQQLIVELLRNEGYHVVIADSGIEALEILATDHNIGLIFMDLHMPKMNGIETTKNIMNMDKAKQIPIVAMTADSLESSRRHALSLGIKDYITKPVDVKNLIEVITKYTKG